MISKKDVQHIAKLARLGLTKQEVRKFQKELSAILDYIEKLKEVNISKVEPYIYSIKVENIMRGDEPEKERIEISKKLIEMAPEKKEGYIKTKSIL